MKICVMSDSHGNTEYIKRVIDFAEKENTNFIIHLGDNYSDMEEFNLPNIIKIPGVYDEEYYNHLIKHRIIKNFEKLRSLLSHTKVSHVNDLPTDKKPEELIEKKEIDLLLYGHTHIPEVKFENGVLFVNPGHLRKEDKKGYPPTFAVLELKEREVIVKILKINFEKFLENSFSL